MGAPALFSYLIKLYIDDLTPSANKTYQIMLLVSIIFICFFSALLRNHTYLRAMTFGLLVRKTLTGMLYEKLLKLPISGVA